MISGRWCLCFALLLIFAERISAQCSRPDTSSCVVFNDTNVKTFDGDVYSFDSTCGYKLVSIETVGLEVNLLKDPSTLQVKYAERTFDVVIKDISIVLTIDGVVYYIPTVLNGVAISKPGRMVVVEIKELGMKIRFDGATVEIIQDNVGHDYPTVGFCGNNDGCASSDLILPNGDTTESQICFANSWTLDSCSTDPSIQACGDNIRLQAQALEYCTSLFSRIEFETCWDYSVGYRYMCMSLYCSCKLPNRDDCMCDMLDAFVRTCQVNTNSLLDWRTTICPIQCENPEQIFLSCAPGKKQLECGEDEIADSTELDCEEGCYCPPGMKLFQGRCLFDDECPCFLGDNWYHHGMSIAQECNTCTCKNGKWECTEKSCTVDAECSGDPHYITFDGRRYDFMGKCEYYVVRGLGFDIICDHYVRIGSNFVKDFQSSLPSYCAKVIIEVQNNVIELDQNHVVRVNGELVGWFPRVVSGIRISKPSSQFTEVALGNGVTATWNGYSRIIARIPTAMNGRVNGLFGTYNENPSDDFTMPDGTLAPNANTFGHSWAVPGSCSPDTNTDPVPHPCEENPAKKPKAEERCGIIKSSLFAGCSDNVDVDYEDCVYDGCLCPDGDVKCFCDFYAQQGEMCAAKGVLIDWRDTITECAIECPKGQKYQVCGNSCTRSCDDISANPRCTSRCVDGCNCPPGETLDDNNECIPISQCPCVLDDARYPATFTFIDTNDDTKHTCRNAIWTVTSSTDDDKDKYPTLLDLQNKCDRDGFLMFSGCKRNNELTCLNKHLNERPNFDNCESGCQCMEGFLMDTEHDTCMKPEDCPCMYKGISYPDDAVVSDREQRCLCLHGSWMCTHQIDHWEMCSVWGNVHVRTFDETVFSFDGSCEYVLLEHLFDETGVFRVKLQTTNCSGGSCVAAAFVHYRDSNGRAETVVFISGSGFIATPNLSVLRLVDLDLSTSIDVPYLGVRVVWNKAGWIHIHANQIWLTRDHSGLCGKYDNDASNDLKIPGTQSTDVGDFVNYNKANSVCGVSSELRPVNAIIPNTFCNILYSDAFRTCRLLRPVQEYFNRCIIEAKIQSGPTNHYCQTISAYAQECNYAGAPVNWRSQDVCPYTCPADKEYSPCENPCPKESCETAEGLATFCSMRVCSEACSRNTIKCARGEIYVDSTYEQCVARDQCPA